MTARPRTIAYVTQAPFIGGAERSLLRLAGALDATRYRPFVVAGHDGEFVAALRAAGLEHCHLPLAKTDRARPWPFVRSVVQLLVALQRRGVSLVHINDATAHHAAALAARMLRLPRLCLLHFSYPADGLRWFLKWGFERAVFPSHFLQRHAQACCPELFPIELCAVVHNGFEPPPPPAPERLAELRRACALDGNEPIVGFVGRIVESKGVADFLTMAAGVLRRIPCRFLLVGDDPSPAGQSYRTQMEALADSLGIAGACRFLGFRDDVWELMHLCTIVVVPSRIEPFATVLLEASAAARPIVATRVGGTPEIVRHGETGWLVEAGDAHGLAEAVYALLCDPARRELFGRNAHNDVATRFTLAQNAARMMEIYDELCPSR
jgi:glycosyltransferase involved in cell wall biosynthesis